MLEIKTSRDVLSWWVGVCSENSCERTTLLLLFLCCFHFSPPTNDVALLFIMRCDAQVYELWRSHDDDDDDLLAKIGLGSSVLAPRGARPP